MRSTALLVLAASLACRGGGDASGDRRTLVDSRDNEDPRSLDPALSTDVPTGRAVAYVFDGLTRFTPDARLEPGLAERWDVSPDGLMYTFHLRQGVKFHDGTPFAARHVVHSFRRALDPASLGGRPTPLLPIKGASDFNTKRATDVAGVVARDDSTVVVTLGEPLAFFPKLLAMPVAAIVPDSTAKDFGLHPVGTGPWKFVEWQHDDFLRFAANQSYWGGAPRFDSLVARIIPEKSTAVAEFESGNVDVLLVPEADTPEWEQTDERKGLLQSAPALRFVHVAINTTRGPLAKREVRQAINHAVDVGSVLRQLFGSRGRRAAGVIPPILEGADTTRQPYAFDPARARQLLAQAGYPNGIDIELWVSPVYVRLAQTIQGYLSQSNIRAKLVQRDAPSVREAARKGETDMSVRDWYADYPDAENFLYPLLYSANKGVGGNYSFYANPEFDRRVASARREQNDTLRARLYREADALAFTDAPMLYLFFYNELYAVQPWVRNFQVPVIFNGQRWLGVELRNRGGR